MSERVTYVVVFDGKATHHCRTLDEARAYAASEPFEGQRPVRIEKVTTVTTTETVETF